MCCTSLIPRSSHLHAVFDCLQKRAWDLSVVTSLATIVKMTPLLNLQQLQWNHPSAIMLQTYVLEVGLVSRLELVLFLQVLCSWRYKWEYLFVSRICDIMCAADHVVGNSIC